ncbi:unnamed protein product [Didymodactylos carnosus]|uniref:LSM domain-containing protein n=1 Tax=Didymodactylos carnosus TaxID=1234261 RepID=A0A8S2I8T7_9BILA|nr:unnamed protein product [Didymodactylos carnosus]CAF3702842.1 unnamed protein product [Didymodactylos carnosus]
MRFLLFNVYIVMTSSDHHCCSHDHSKHDDNHSVTASVSTSIGKPVLANSTSTINYNVDDETKTVSQLFDIAWKIQNNLQDSNIDTTSDDYATKLSEEIRLLKLLEERIQALDLFSKNEHYDEVTTNNIRYFLIYAFLGWLYQTKRSKPSARIINVQQACDYYKKFLTITKQYFLHQHQIPEPLSTDGDQIDLNSPGDLAKGNRNMTKMAQDRASKIRGHMKRREDEEAMYAYEEAMKRDTTDEEAKRNFYLSKVRWWINVAIDDIDCLYEELKLLQQRALLTDDNEILHRPQKTTNPLKTMILTRDQLQSKVFGAGYPSISTMTVNEFYQNLTKQGFMPTEEEQKALKNAPMTFPTASDMEKETIAKEEHVEKDDPNMIRYLRSKDEFKEEHLRVGKDVVVELKNDLSIAGTLHSVDQYLNVKLTEVQVLDPEKYPHIQSVKHCFIRGSVIRYIQLPPDDVDTQLLQEATRKELFFIAMLASTSTSLRCFPVRYGPGTEIISAVHRLMEANHLKATFIMSCVGSVRSATVRFAATHDHTTLTTPHEIVSLVGTFDEKTHHIHGSFSDSKGNPNSHASVENDTPPSRSSITDTPSHLTSNFIATISQQYMPSPRNLRNPSPPKESQDDLPRDDMIGDTMYSKSWLCKVLLKLIELVSPQSHESFINHIRHHSTLQKSASIKQYLNSPLSTSESPTTSTLSKRTNSPSNIVAESSSTSSPIVLELEEIFENELCELWDISVNRDVVQLLYDFNSLELFLLVLLECKYQRCIEIVIGIIGNMACSKGDDDTVDNNISLKIVQHETLIQTLINLLSIEDCPTLIQLFRLFYTLLLRLDTRSFMYEHIKSNSAICYECFCFILQSCLNSQLLYHCSCVLLILLDECEMFEHEGINNTDETSRLLLDSLCNAINTIIEQNEGVINTTVKNETLEHLFNCLQIYTTYLNLSILLAEYKDTIMKLVKIILERLANDDVVQIKSLLLLSCLSILKYYLQEYGLIILDKKLFDALLIIVNTFYQEKKHKQRQLSKDYRRQRSRTSSKSATNELSHSTHRSKHRHDQNEGLEQKNNNTISDEFLATTSKQSNELSSVISTTHSVPPLPAAAAATAANASMCVDWEEDDDEHAELLRDNDNSLNGKRDYDPQMSEENDLHHTAYEIIDELFLDIFYRSIKNQYQNSMENNLFNMLNVEQRQLFRKIIFNFCNIEKRLNDILDL